MTAVQVYFIVNLLCAIVAVHIIDLLLHFIANLLVCLDYWVAAWTANRLLAANRTIQYLL